MNGEAVPDFGGHFVAKDITERLAAMDVLMRTIRNKAEVGSRRPNGFAAMDHFLRGSGILWRIRVKNSL
jgi:hypothetical protein